MEGQIKHSWNGTVLTITSDSGTSSADLKGEKGDTGIRGAQGVAGIIVDNATGEDIVANTKEYVDSILGDINTVLDSVIAKQEEYIGGNE
jgi:hypothetical protein